MNRSRRIISALAMWAYALAGTPAATQATNSWVEWTESATYGDFCASHALPGMNITRYKDWHVRFRNTCWDGQQPTWISADPTQQATGECIGPQNACEPLFQGYHGNGSVIVWWNGHAINRYYALGCWEGTETILSISADAHGPYDPPCPEPPPSSCPDTCNNECPEPPNSEVTDCQIQGPTDYCAYANGCPNGEDSYNGCCFVWGTPLVLDMGGRGFNLTDLAAGVRFPIGKTDAQYRVSWTSPGSDNAWLALDRNANGRIDNARELFGNATDQAPPNLGEQPNGFRALAMFDLPRNGGNGDGRIDAQDRVFGSLLLWRDQNHDGQSQPAELQALASSGVSAIELAYRSAQRRDGGGNIFRYRARVHADTPGAIGPWVYDVFLRVAR